MKGTTCSRSQALSRETYFKKNKAKIGKLHYHSDANQNMGVLAVGVGKVQEALPFFKTALEAA